MSRAAERGKRNSTGSTSWRATDQRSSYAEFNRVLTSVGRKTHSLDLYEIMGARAKISISPYLFGVLSRIYDLQPVRVSDVAREMDYDRSTVSRHVSELTELGCIERVADPTDRRAIILKLTKVGARAIQQVIDAWIDFLEELIGDWSEADRKALLDLLRRFDTVFTEHYLLLISAPKKRLLKP